jgi:hypothetical protein
VAVALGQGPAANWGVGRGGSIEGARRNGRRDRGRELGGMVGQTERYRSCEV